MEALENGKGERAQAAALLVMRDLVIFLGILAFVAVLYRVSPGALLGSRQTLRGTQSLESAAALSAQVPAETDAPAVIESAAAADVSPTTPQPAPTPGPATEPTAVPAAAPVNPPQKLDSATASGDFSAVFPTADTGAGALHSYQSDTLRVAINKVQESGVVYFVADVWVKNIDTFATAFAKGEYGRSIHEMPRVIANSNNAVFAVSGDYYGARDKGVVIRNGKLYRDVAGDDVCVLRRDGTLSTYLANEFSALNADDTVWQAWAFGPALVKNGAVCDVSHSNIKVKNPRCGVGCYESGHYCFIVVDGRQDGYSSGMTLDAFAKTFQSLGVTDAYNLDGGATAQMVFEGQVVNHQTKGGRAVSDILYFA